ncbi:MAG: ABC transporter permease, partial [Gammaproteobacteria bacterium]
MSSAIQAIPLLNLAIAFIPAFIGILILIKWSLNSTNAIYAISRMLVQLLLIGYFLSYLFNSDNSLIVLAVLMVMVFASSWIALGTIAKQRQSLFKQALISIVIGAGLTLLLVTQAVLELKPWYLPQYMIPLAGMLFANSM